MAIYEEKRPVAVSDTECYVDYWSIGFKSLDGKHERVFELYDGHPLNKKAIASIFRRWTIITFNGNNYDMPMIMYAMSGATNGELKQASDEIIQFGVPGWKFLDRLGLSIPEFVNHIDLWSVSPGAPQMPSLKIYAGRLHSRKMQELPIRVDERLGDRGREIIRAYHGNDLDVTIDMCNDLKAQIELRRLMSIEYGVDLRSKSDAQIAEVVIKAEIERVTGNRVYAPDVVPGFFNYVPPSFISFQTEKMRLVLEQIKGMRFMIDGGGNVRAPEDLKDLKITIGQSVYRVGIGGLHSSETRTSHYSNDEYVLCDRDVTSYYPMIILLCRLYPKHIGSLFLKVYKRIFDRRVAAKKGGDKNTAETLKIVLNGSFGKFGNAYSALYSPNLMIQTTMTGQLAVLMLIETLELRGFNVVSANTDGFVTKVPRNRRDEFILLCGDWELDTGLTTEETEYLSLHSRDVNNYIALKKGKGDKIEVKTKGAYAASGPGLPGAAGLKKNPDMDICVDAVVEHLKHGTAIEDTIEWCADPRKFLTVRRVTGGAQDENGVAIGKALRWYYSTEVKGSFTYVKNGNSVPQSRGAKTMMELLPHVPHDIDHDYYIREAYAILQDIGVADVDPRLSGRSGIILAHLPDAKSIHKVDAQTGIALCGKARDSIRDSWVEYDDIPEGHKMCHKCRKIA